MGNTTDRCYDCGADCGDTVCKRCLAAADERDGARRDCEENAMPMRCTCGQHGNGLRS